MMWQRTASFKQKKNGRERSYTFVAATVFVLQMQTNSVKVKITLLCRSWVYVIALQHVVTSRLVLDDQRWFYGGCVKMSNTWTTFTVWFLRNFGDVRGETENTNVSCEFETFCFQFGQRRTINSVRLSNILIIQSLLKLIPLRIIMRCYTTAITV